MQETRLLALLLTLRESEIQFVLVGGLAAVLNGAPIQTYDVDIVYSREPTNIERLLRVLAALDAIFRIQPERRLRPAASHLAAAVHLNLITRYGPLDLLATIGQDLAFEELLPLSTEILVGEGVRIPVLNLETLVDIKEQLAGEKDLAVLPILRQTLRELRNKRIPNRLA